MSHPDATAAHAAAPHTAAYSPLDALLAAPWPLLGTLQLALTIHNVLRFQGARAPTPKAGEGEQPAAAPSPGAGARALGGGSPAPAAPRLSIVLPARDEAPRLPACVAAVLAQTFTDWELLVLDDGSTDGTAEAAAAAAGGDERVRVIPVPEPEPGWGGKAWACTKGFEEARGAWLMFLDADVLMGPGSLEAALSAAETAEADMLSWWPRAASSPPLDALLVPLRTALPLAFLPLLALESLDVGGLTWVNGQCLLVSRKGYERAGGHAAARATPAEDQALARAVKASGGRVITRDAGPGTIAAASETPKALLESLRKDLYPLLGCDDRQLGVVIAVLVLMDVLPPLAALLGFLLNSPGLMSAGLFQTLQPVVGRLWVAWRLGQPLWSPLAHPFAVTAVVGLAIASRLAWRKGGVMWKGRAWPAAGATAAPAPPTG